MADSPPNICSHSSGPQTRTLTTCTTNRGNSSLLPSKPQGSQRSQKQSLQTPFPIPAATEPTQQQQQPSEQPPQQQKSPPQPETWPQAVTAHQQGAAGDDETEGAIRAESQGLGRCLRSNLSRSEWPALHFYLVVSRSCVCAYVHVLECYSPFPPNPKCRLVVLCS